MRFLVNTENFARGLPANNALLGRSGHGKEYSLVKAVHAEAAARQGEQRPARRSSSWKSTARTSPPCPRCLPPTCARQRRRFIVFCDDLSFDARRYILQIAEGGSRRRHRRTDGNVVFYATSNRRHLMPRDMMENERADRDQSRRGRRGEGFAVGPFRPLDRLPQLQPGRLSRHGQWLCRLLWLEGPAGAASRRGAGMGDDARIAVGAGRLAVYPGSGRPAWAAARLTNV